MFKRYPMFQKYLFLYEIPWMEKEENKNAQKRG
jgi:hypothetical protein